MINAQEARQKLENVDILTEEDIDKAERRTLEAIEQGRNIAGLSFDRRAPQFVKMYPLKKYLCSLGYNITFSNYTNTTVLNWSW